MAAIEQEGGQREPGYARCAGTTNAGYPCRSKAINGSEFCMFHVENHQELQQRGSQVAAVRRSVRERFREDAERDYELLHETIRQAIDSQLTAWSDCPKCNHKVAHKFPDIRAQLQAIGLLLDQGYGKPALSIRQEIDIPPGARYDELSEEQKAQVLRDAKRKLVVQHEVTPPEQKIEELEARLAEIRAQVAASNGRAGG